MTTTFGSVARRGELVDLTFDRVYATTVPDVWSAVTEPARLARWMTTYTGDLRLGGRWDAHETDGSVYCSGTVTECDPPHRYVTTWEYEGVAPSTVTVTVTEHPEGALLVLQHDGIAQTGYAPGWQAYLEQLDESLPVGASSQVDPDRPAGVTWEARYEALRPVWSARLAATTGSTT
ncbi:SRPBCC family protein [Actinotalea sp. K2]|uniref:SRPBCC family protein n=1 Tax=Actinotalea sp. K2 TaxID=2939438 RepID=UPI0020172CD6|nr:SRPBCC family protein [Actinotalea sp. K2]MCL3859886.1 SRPBCC family protein [Actinotalea sp. K2]